jgi:hypothetical protein
MSLVFRFRIHVAPQARDASNTQSTLRRYLEDLGRGALESQERTRRLFRGGVASPGGFEFYNGFSRKLSANAVLAEKSRRLLGKPLPFGPV